MSIIKRSKRVKGQICVSDKNAQNTVAARGDDRLSIIVAARKDDRLSISHSLIDKSIFALS
jgi:hypothetical protein